MIAAVEKTCIEDKAEERRQQGRKRKKMKKHRRGKKRIKLGLISTGSSKGPMDY